MNGWVKYFLDSTVEIGTDNDVRLKKASWSRGRLSDMTGAKILFNNKGFLLQGIGSYWQSDDLDAKIFDKTSSLAVRRLQKQIDKDDMWIYVTMTDTGKKFTVQNARQDPYSLPPANAQTYAVTKDLVGKWLTLEYHIESNETRMYFSDTQI